MRYIKRKSLPLICILICLFLCSCSSAEVILSKLGFDTHDYGSEAVVSTHEPDSDAGKMISGMIKILCIDSPYLKAFDATDEAAEIYKDSVLNYMVSSDYAKYTGTDLVDEALEAYPHMTLTTIIPASDFEATMYTYFGGSVKVINSNGHIFSYLDKVNAYTSVTKPKDSKVVTNIIKIEETEKTYRAVFVNQVGDIVSPEYFALIIKRDDGSCYFSEIRENINQ